MDTKYYAEKANSSSIDSAIKWKSVVANVKLLSVIAELITNALDAALHGTELLRKVDVSIVKGCDYSFLESGKTYLRCINSGSPIRDFVEMLANGISPRVGRNHVCGMGFKYAMAKLSEMLDFFVATLINGEYRYVKGPYGEYVEEGTLFKKVGLEAIPSGYVTAIYIPIDDKEHVAALKRNDAYDFLSIKYSLELWRKNSDEHTLDIVYNGVPLVSRIPREATCSIHKAIPLPQFGIEITIYEFTLPDGCGSIKTQGVYVGMEGVLIEHLGVYNAIQKQNRLGTEWVPGQGLVNHPNGNRYEDYADIHVVDNNMAENFYKTLTSDKDGFHYEYEAFKDIRLSIDNEVGDKYRASRAEELEKTIERVYASLLYRTLKADGYIVLCQPKIRATDEKDAIPDIVCLKTDSISEKLRKAVETAEDETGYVLNYVFCKEDFSENAIVKIYEAKKRTFTFAAKEFGQLVGYGTRISQIFGTKTCNEALHFISGNYSGLDYDTFSMLAEYAGFTELIWDKQLMEIED